LRRFIYGKHPASQNDFHGITIHELPEQTMEDENDVISSGISGMK